MYKELFHGTNSHFDKFDPLYLNTENSIDQYGSGFYFYDCIAPTIRHGGNVVFAKCHIEKILDIDESYKHKLSRDQIEILILQSPELDLCLTNFGDVEFESYDKVLNRAIDLYLNMDIVHTLNIIGNDFFKNKNVHILLKKFIELTGFNCFQKKFIEYSIWVFLDANDIEILKMLPFEKIN
jgi:hypothetical protein